ncbi:hypothetical protein BJP34_24510 [Moorena producens PAL-8-15-08-1]|uniref:Ice-binding protein C-terminal domain-containing protein n=1 Tax=Moorena producens PAL-8-15-08-1 TaxID=1458985 RepID=A0A1D8TX21_9CYAN|nr:hypothetical protein BJP34_24510 [Moorena producens PAL-8-15-08-1]
MDRLTKSSVNLLNSIFASSIALGLTVLTGTSAQALSLKVTVQNTSVEQGVFFSPFWFGFHDGSFDTFTPGEKASLPLEIIAEDGIVGLELITPEFKELANLATFFGATLPPPEDTLAGLFAASEPDGLQSIAFANVFGFGGGSEFSFFVDIDPTIQTSVSYAAMVLPSHDGFVGDVDPITLFSPDGVFLPQKIEIRGADVFDAGTEENIEDVSTTPIIFNPPERFFGAFRQGKPEDALIRTHPLLKEPGQGGFLDLPNYVNGDFTRNPNQIYALINIEQVSVPEPTSTFSLLAIGLLGVTSIFKRKLKPCN